jgi:hypothetical protein
MEMTIGFTLVCLMAVTTIYGRWFGSFGKPSRVMISMYLRNGLAE